MTDVARNTILYVLVVSLLVYVAWLGARATWLLFGEENSTPMVIASKAETKSNQVRDRSVSIPGYKLFGRLGDKPVAIKEEKPKEAPKTTLRLRLKGVFTAEQAKSSGAIIEEIGKKSAYYRVGDSVSGNAVLEEVYDDRVLLKRNGKLETLLFEETKGKDRTQIAKAKPKPNARKKTDGKQEIKSPEQFMEVATQQLAEDPEKALSSVGLTASANGGYVYNGKNPMLAGLNLKKGDVIRSVNGHNLGDIQKDRNLLKSLYEQGSLEVEVQRDGTSFYVNYPLR